ncbi:hypothetical protein BS78_04G317000 [Paspalum vaginatum]|nr:hypothetical protein BS78_04G317000 [Paspalum vaginatum]
MEEWCLHDVKVWKCRNHGHHLLCYYACASLLARIFVAIWMLQKGLHTVTPQWKNEPMNMQTRKMLWMSLPISWPPLVQGKTMCSREDLWLLPWPSFKGR